VTLVVDASVAAKWFLPEAGTPEAEAVLRHPAPLLAPELIVAEVASALWKAIRRGAARPAQAGGLPERLSRALRMTPLPDLAEAALALALRRDHSVYDCFYVALAAREAAPLLTADRRLLARFADDADIRLLDAPQPSSA